MSWKRTFRAVWAANFVTSAAMMSFLPFFPSLLEELGLTDRHRIAVWSGLCFGAAPLSATLMSPIWGTLGDRFGRRIMVLRAMLAIAIFVGGMAFATTPLQIFLLRIGQGLFSGFIPPSITLVSIAAPAHRQGRIVADLQTALPLGAVIGPFLGGLIATTGGHRSVFLFVAAAALLSALLVYLFADEDKSTRRAGERVGSAGATFRQMLRDVGEIWSHPHVRAIAVLVLCLQFGLGATNPLLELHVRDLVGPDPPGAWFSALARLPGMSDGSSAGQLAFATSLLFGGMALVNLICMPFWGRIGDRMGHRRALVVAAAANVMALLLQAAAQHYVWLLAGRLLMGLALAGTGPLAFGVAAASTSVDRRGGAFGVVFSARTLAVAIGGALGGALARWIGIEGLMLASAGLVVLALLLLGRSRAQVTEERPSLKRVG